MSPFSYDPAFTAHTVQTSPQYSVSSIMSNNITLEAISALLASQRTDITNDIKSLDLTSDIDEGGHEYRKVFKFELSPVVEGSGALTVQLFNSQQKLQLQGSSLVDMSTTVPVWFFNNVLNNVFTQNARDKRNQIDSFNYSASTLSNSIPYNHNFCSLASCNRK